MFKISTFGLYQVVGMNKENNVQNNVENNVQNNVENNVENTPACLSLMKF